MWGPFNDFQKFEKTFDEIIRMGIMKKIYILTTITRF